MLSWSKIAAGLGLTVAFTLCACQSEAQPLDNTHAPDNVKPAAVAGDDAGSKPAKVTKPATKAVFISAYTDSRHDPAKCRELYFHEDEGGAVGYECEGFRGIPLIIQEGDLRNDVDAGVDDQIFDTIGAFNLIGDKIEWRMRGNTPFAIIVRLKSDGPDTPKHSVLQVKKIGKVGAPGCLIAEIDGGLANANQLARNAADAAWNKACPPKE